MNQQILARELIKDEPKYIWFLPVNQHTLPRLEDGSYQGILNQAGQDLYQEVLELVEAKQYQGTFIDWKEVRYNSGGWSGTQEHYQLMSELISPKLARLIFSNDSKKITMFNTWNNSIIEGHLEGIKYESGKVSSTSCILFYGEDWVYTATKSLYLLTGPKKFLPILKVAQFR